MGKIEIYDKAIASVMGEGWKMRGFAVAIQSGGDVGDDEKELVAATTCSF